nr:Gfo/Idh/MocA family oxidoreductase [Candidatus Omnitrophota bacterium]
MKKLKLAIIGLGHLGSLHLKIFKEFSQKADIVGICDSKDGIARRLAEENGIPFFHTDYTQLLGKVDAVSICTPTESHYEIGKFFLSHNIHVFIEKPIAKTVA